MPVQGGIQLMLPGIVQQQSQMWQGPYPPPEAVERYEAVLPGTLNRLITMAEKLQEAQIEQSRLSLQHAQSDVRRGHWLGFATTGLAMIGAIIAVQYNAWVAGAFLSVPVMAVAKALIETTKAPTQTDLLKAAAEVQAAPTATGEQT
ncbi:DUF2335 domain-containing protein [Bradyrhizobium sp. CCBAU 51745]|uniref:DUF2335 domain-containing protein n=1 Tax=Bradyrhizobium sp. CCBAU 51745 TaxID=1325099 RepID=UPI002306DAD0|nr:DUF2335 domain-containing protein [Bradyrhizobium sp. CCBAU 51745]